MNGSSISSKRVVFVANTARFLMTFLLPHMRYFRDRGYEVFCASNFKEETDRADAREALESMGFTSIQLDLVRSPFSKQNYAAYQQLKLAIEQHGIGLVHCHTPVGAFLGRMAAKPYRQQGLKVVYVCHGFHFFKGAPLKNWLMWYPIESYLTQFTDLLLTINQEDYEKAQSFAKCPVAYIPGIGIDVSRFEAVPGAPNVLCNGDGGSAFNIIAIGDLNANKNHEVLIEALAALPQRVHLHIAGEGSLRSALGEKAQALGVADRVHLLGYRSDVQALLQSCDLFCIPSKREGLPVSLLEAMAASKPCLGSNIRGCRDLLGAFPQCLILDNNAAAWAQGINAILSSDNPAALGAALRAKAEGFGIEAVLKACEMAYERHLFST